MDHLDHFDILPLLLSLNLAFTCTVLLLAICIPFAYFLAGRPNFFKLVMEAIFTMPLVLPPSVLGFYLLVTFGEHGKLGQFLLNHLNLRLVFSYPGMLIASMIYSIPFMLGPLKNAFQAIPNNLLQASASLGKNPMQTFLRIQLPLAKKGILSGVILTFAHTLGEFGVVLMIGGNIPGKTRLASIAIYDYVEQMDYASAAIYSGILLGISFLMIMTLFLLTRSRSQLF